MAAGFPSQGLKLADRQKRRAEVVPERVAIRFRYILAQAALHPIARAIEAELALFVDQKDVSRPQFSFGADPAGSGI